MFPTGVAVMSIDLGSEFMKIAIVKVTVLFIIISWHMFVMELWQIDSSFLHDNFMVSAYSRRDNS